ncbi:CPBP family intramembrane metalloprotease [Aquimarina sp. TRL1]|uniref:CPBP family intramembrane glutamic endopeptidase n=1 Tax=Aquimarina sp. (strain TRL1) TaxID=2736252 RepID=UPI00158AAD5B|nr:CPBP family intramembrane glutamic endopeptidase [Aquimarina sp. TRL1]QKX06800.1 CPBP family intramembrane metalloprotease [Aquimarina sp. TRL1]
MKSTFWNQLALFTGSLLLILVVREYLLDGFLQKGDNSYQSHTIVRTIANLMLILISYILIKKNDLLEAAGIKGTTLRKWYLLLFPLIYLVVLNLLIMDAINPDLLLSNIVIFTIYSLSIGIAEEISIRGFLQSHLIHRLGNTKKNIVLSIIIASLFFGIIHLIDFEKGIYGEFAQVCYAACIGIMFGVLLVITKRIYPLMIVHAIIDFVGDSDAVGLPIKEVISEPTSIENAILIVLLILPCLIYGIILMKKHPLIKETV